MRGDLIRLAAVTVAAAGVVARPPAATACGFDFPIELLSQRSETLFELQEGVFAAEAARLVPAPATPYPFVATEPEGARTRGAPAERALYERGAAAFRAGNTDGAIAAFAAVLALPPDLRRHRSTWAAFMLGRLQTGAASIAAFAEVRRLVDAGFVDELGLAAASLGAEANRRAARDELVAAVHGFAAQAAHGHPDGAISLLLLCRDVIRRGTYQPLLADPVGQRLLAGYLFSRAGELTEGERARVWRDLAAQDPLAGADRLAAAAYRQGDWDLAGAIARRAPATALARWVLAKLALRDGDRATASRLLAEAAAALPRDPIECYASEDFAGHAAADRVAAERAIVGLADGRYAAALELAWQARATYPLEWIRIAERVVTLDELRGFVDARRADPPVSEYDDATAGTALAALLARRLTRAGRHADAYPYFPPELRAHARAYAAAIARGRAGDDPIARAGALYRASRIAREHGLELLGTEGAPDWHLYGASFAPGSDPDEDPALVTDGERDRVAASAPAFPHRYHYRFAAAALAEEAADLLPRQSQAFAAVLCHAHRYVNRVDRERADALYVRFVRDGARVDFASTFGERCPEPALGGARRYLPRPPPSRRPFYAAYALWLALLGLGSFTRRRRAR